jgi:hypothetical protein
VNRFETSCRAVAAKVGVDVIFFDDGPKAIPDCYEDDGNLHIRRGGFRACFDVGCGQSLTGSEQNQNIRAVLTALKMQKAIGKRTLADEDVDEESTCPNCGYSR